MRKGVSLFTLVGIVALLIVLFYQNLALSKVDKRMKGLAYLNAEYISYINTVCTKAEEDELLFSEMSSLLMQDSSLVVYIPNNSCGACLTSLMLELKDFCWPVQDVILLGQSPDFFKSNKYVLGGYQMVGTSRSANSDYPIVMRKLSDGQPALFYYHESFKDVFLRFLHFE